MASRDDARDRGRPPLKPVLYEILLAIGCGASHGYAIRQEVEERTGGAVKLWPTTLYGSLRQLREEGLLEELAGDERDERDPRGKRPLRLTAAGVEALEAETRRLEALTRLARTRSVLAE